MAKRKMLIVPVRGFKTVGEARRASTKLLRNLEKIYEEAMANGDLEIARKTMTTMYDRVIDMEQKLFEVGDDATIETPRDVRRAFEEMERQIGEFNARLHAIDD